MRQVRREGPLADEGKTFQARMRILQPVSPHRSCGKHQDDIGRRKTSGRLRCEGVTVPFLAIGPSQESRVANVFASSRHEGRGFVRPVVACDGAAALTELGERRSCIGGVRVAIARTGRAVGDPRR